MTTVIAFGSFDVLHPGHLSYLEQARALGDRLVVIIGRDKNVEQVKGVCPIFNETQRLRIISALKVVDEAILGHEEDFIQSIMKVKPEIIALGFDQNMSESGLEKELIERNFFAKIVRLNPFQEQELKSGKIKEKIKKM